jgi:flagellin
MALSVLNNIPSLVAQNQLQVTGNNLQNTLFQLSSGSKINSGSDDPAGLSIVNGLQANISALTQSSQNATDGVGQLQVADGALSQVTTLLNRAVTLATEAANGGLTTAQFSAVTNEYGSITSEINRIGQATNFNGTQVFSSVNAANPNQAVTTATSALGVNTALTAGNTTTVQLGNNAAYTYTAGASATTLLGTGTGTTANTGIVNGKTISITNGGGTVNFTAGPLTYTGATPTTAATATTLNDNITVVSGGRTTTYAGGAISTVGAWLSGFNTAADAAGSGLTASLNGGVLQIQGTSSITSVTQSAANTTDFGALTNNPLNYVGTTATANATAATALNESLTIVNAAGTTTYAGGAATVGAWVTAFNAAANTAGFGVTASLNSQGYLQVNSTSAITTVTQGAGNTTDFGTLAKAGDNVGDLINQINTSGYGLTASINGAGQFQVTSSNGAISATNNNTTSTLGTVAATNTIQDLINGINASGLGVTAALAPVTNANEIVSANAVTAGGVITAGGTLTLNSGTATNGVYPNTFTYTATAGTTGNIADPVAGTQGNNTVQGLIDAINNSGTAFHAYIDGSGKLDITDGTYSGNITTAGTLAGAGTPGAFTAAPQVQQLEITDSQNRGNLAVQSNDAVLGYVGNTGGNPLKGGNADAFIAPGTATGSSGASVFISDGQVSNAYNTIKVAIGALSANKIGTNTTTLLAQNLGTAAGASTALGVINTAISDVAAMRGTIGAGVNRLNSATNVINTQIQNLTSAQSSIQDANIGQVVANMSKYQVLEQTGISALAQSNQNEQAVLKLLQ